MNDERRSRVAAHTHTRTHWRVHVHDTFICSPEKSQWEPSTRLNVAYKPNNGILSPTHAPGVSLCRIRTSHTRMCVCVMYMNAFSHAERDVSFLVWWKRWNAVSVTNAVWHAQRMRHRRYVRPKQYVFQWWCDDDNDDDGEMTLKQIHNVYILRRARRSRTNTKSHSGEKTDLFVFRWYLAKLKTLTLSAETLPRIYNVVRMCVCVRCESFIIMCGESKWWLLCVPFPLNWRTNWIAR